MRQSDATEFEKRDGFTSGRMIENTSTIKPTSVLPWAIQIERTAKQAGGVMMAHFFDVEYWRGMARRYRTKPPKAAAKQRRAATAMAPPRVDAAAAADTARFLIAFQRKHFITQTATVTGFQGAVGLHQDFLKTTR
ncbi:MAG: hypothetical protein R3C56_21705 [Pirellulaceae bacterium]